jgi:integrase
VLGARKGELAALKWLDFDLDVGVCTIRRALSYVPGRPIFEKTTKEEDVRPLTIDNPVVALLRAQRARQAEMCLAVGVRFDDNAYVFHRPGQPRTPVHLEDHNRRFARLRARVLEIAGEPVTLRSLRAFVVTELLDDDTNVVDVAARLGNTPGTIYKYYAAKRPARDKDVMAKMRRKLGG